jgi:hypothetical protein
MQLIDTVDQQSAGLHIIKYIMRLCICLLVHLLTGQIELKCVVVLLNAREVVVDTPHCPVSVT